MRQRNVITTTLGELIVAVTDAVIPMTDDPAEIYAVVSSVVNDVLAHRQLGVRRGLRPKYPGHFVQLR